MVCGRLAPADAPGTVRSVTDTHPAPSLRVVVIDPDDRTRESLCGVLVIGEQCLVVGSAGDADAALELLRHRTPDLVAIDAHLETPNGMPDFILRVRERAPGSRVVLLSRFDASDPVDGADGVVRKTFRPRELLGALAATIAAARG